MCHCRHERPGPGLEEGPHREPAEAMDQPAQLVRVPGAQALPDHGVDAKAVDEQVVRALAGREKLGDHVKVGADAAGAVLMNTKQSSFQSSIFQSNICSKITNRYSATCMGVEWQLSSLIPWNALAVCSAYSLM